MKDKPNQKLVKIVQRLYLAQHKYQVNCVAKWVLAIENYIATCTLSPRCPETNWKYMVQLSDIRKLAPHLKGIKLSFDIEMLIAKTLEERDLTEVEISARTGKIFFQYK